MTTMIKKQSGGQKNFDQVFKELQEKDSGGRHTTEEKECVAMLFNLGYFGK